MKNLPIYPLSAHASLRVLLVLVLLSGSLLLAAPTLVTLTSPTSPSHGDPTLTKVNVTGTGFPTGTISPSNVTVTLTPTSPGPPTAQTKAIAVTVVSGSTERITFRIPKSVSVTSPTSYQVSIAGKTSTGATFKSSNTAALTINPILTITTMSPLPTATVGAAYPPQTLMATGGSGSYTWAITSGALPGGLSLSVLGVISGTPTVSGTFSFTATVTDSIRGAVSAPFTMTVNPALVITTNSPLPQGTVSMSYSQTLMATGGSGTYTWSVSSGSLPANLGLTGSTGVISGTPSTAATSTFTIQVTDTNNVSTNTIFSLTVNPPVVITTNSPLPDAQLGVSYSQTLMATGGSGTYTWTITAGSLPGGMSLSTSGLISGTPSATATANFTVTATDTNQATGSKAFGLTVDPAATLMTVSPNAANAGLTLQVSLTGSFTHLVQGTTVASFGPNTTVGGGASGQAGPVTVNSLTSATALVTINSTATTGMQTVTVTTGSEQVSLTSAFTINAAVPFITVDTTSPTTIATNFSGFTDEYLLHAVEYNDPKYVPMVQALHPGWIRYPSGLPSQAFDWQSGLVNTTWYNTLSPYLNSTEQGGIQLAQKIAQVKGGGCFVASTATPPCYSDFTTFINTLGIGGVVDYNGYTDINPNSAGLMVQAAQTAGSNIIEWELANEPYGYLGYWPFINNGGTNPAAYLTYEYNNYFLNMTAVNPNVNTGVFFQGQFSSINASTYPAWDAGMQAYTPQYWGAVSTHIYPITKSTLSTSTEEQQLNAILGFATTDYVKNYLAPIVGGKPIYITEVNSDAFATLNFETYLYNGIFLAEYVARMSTSPYVKVVGVQELFLGNGSGFQQGLIRAVNDYQSYLLGQLAKNPSFRDNTATDPNTQFQFYYSTSALAMEVANLAINSSNAIWPTVLNGTIPTVPTQAVMGYGGTPIPAVFAQAYAGITGTHYLLITNKSNQSLPFAIEVNGSLLEQPVTLTYVTNASETAANTATNQTNVVVQTTTSANPITIGPYSVTTVQW